VNFAEPHLMQPTLLHPGGGDRYPTPIVGHTAATTKARTRIAAIRRLPEAHALSEEIGNARAHENPPRDEFGQEAEAAAE